MSLAVVMTVTAMTYAQSETNSPYSQFGFGTLAERGAGQNRSMSGLGIGLRQGNEVNPVNPASYSAVDSLTFIFDMGLSLELTNYKENGISKNANSANFEHATAVFRAAKNIGLSFGVRPFSNVGYNYYNTTYINSDKTTTSSNTYSGSGGIHDVYVGAGWRPFGGLSVGANVSYLWGSISRSVVNSYSDSYINSLGKYYSMSVRSYLADFGVQYDLPLGKEDRLTIGATYGLGHKANADIECDVVSNNSQTSVKDSTTYKLDDIDIPTSIGVGFAYSHGDKWLFGADYSLEKWGSVKFPTYSGAGTGSYTFDADQLKDRHKITVGGQIQPARYSRNFLKRVLYRAGVSYATPYIKINGQDGPKELKASIGFGIPIMNKLNDRSILNITGQFIHVSAKDMITENSLCINIGLTFNERWFMKWKVE